MFRLNNLLGITGISLALGCSYYQENDSDNKNSDKSDTSFYIKTKEDLKNVNSLMDSIFYYESVKGDLETKFNPANPLNLDSNYKYSEKELKKFNLLIDSTLNESKQKNSNAIIINKSDYALYIIKKGKVKYKYPVELGFNPYDDKKLQGDGCTPEGMYKVVQKKDEDKSSFDRAFLLDYPNAEDRKKGKTGSAIEIHGKGSGSRGNDNDGRNWTLGCIALSNKDIDDIFSYINKDDRITVIRYTDKNLDKRLLFD